MNSQNDALEGLLEICDEIRILQDRASRQAGEGDEAPVKRVRAKVRSLRKNVYAALPRMTTEQSGAGDLADPELLVLALLFHGRVTGREHTLAGSQLVALLAKAGFRRVEALALLEPAGRLVAGGWVRPERPSADHHYPLDARFAPSALALDLFWPSVLEEALAAEEEEAPPYANEEECLWDLFRWRNLCLQRAGALFDPERPDALPSPRYRALRREARASLVRVRARLAATRSGQQFRVERFRREHRLGFDEMLLIVHYLFGELVEGEPYISALECLRMVAETRGDLFRKRRLVSKNGRLRRDGILNAASEEYDKSLATELSLADWVADELLAGMSRTPRLQDGELDDLLRGDDSE